MVSLDCTTTRDGGVTLVTAQVTNTGRRRSVRLEHDADGPVWPPRTEGVPVAGWEGTTFECVLAAGERRAVGYATPATVTDPLTVAETEPVDDPPDAEGSADGPVPAVADSSEGVVRALGSPVPPRDAVPEPDLDPDGGTEPAGSDPGPGLGSDSDPDVSDAATTPQSASPTDPPQASTTDGSSRSVDADAVADWLATVETRIAAAEELSDSASVATATPAVRRLGGLAGVRDAAADLDDEAARLRSLAERAETLAARAEAADLPVETLARLA